MPVLVNPVVMKDTMADVKLGMEILVGPDELELAKKKQHAQAMAQTPTVVDKDSLGLNMKIDGMNISVAQKEKK